MVGFRAFVVATATVGGTVCNLPDGSVECIAEGQRRQIEELIVRLRQGPPAARVDSVEVSWQRPGGMYTGMRAI
jgi:acylphosphatase